MVVSKSSIKMGMLTKEGPTNPGTTRVIVLQVKVTEGEDDVCWALKGGPLRLDMLLE